MDDKREEYLKILVIRLKEIASLSIEPSKLETAENLFRRYTDELNQKIQGVNEMEYIEKHFNHYINNILSVLETFTSKDSYQPMRRLVLNEIHGCKETIFK